MAEDRAAETDIDAIARLSAELADLRSTLLARVGRSATGTVEPTILPVPKPDTLFLQGQTLARATYPALWQWVTDNSLLGAGLFGAGDNATTFTLPDLRGRVLIGAGTLGADTYAVGQLVGAARLTLATNQMPAHDHNVSVNNHANHSHGGHTADVGTHGGHHATQVLVAAGGDYGVTTNVSGNNGSHIHGLVIDFNPVDGHTTNESLVGGSTPVDVRQPSIAMNWLIWT